jgi:predicted ester cyclase
MDRRNLLNRLAAGGIGVIALGVGGVPALGATKDNAAAGRKLAREFAASLTAHDMARFGAIIADDYQQHQAIAPAAGVASGGSAKEGVLRYFGARVKALPDLVVKAEMVVTSGNRMAANFVYSGTHQGEYFGVAPTGKRLTFNSTDIFIIRNGQLAEHWGAADLLGLMQQMKG